MSLGNILWYVILSLGIPGNILSAIVWLRRQVASKNSSAVYLAALAINDLAYQLFEIIIQESNFRWFVDPAWLLRWSAGNLEPLLVLGFSIERLIAILRPLQVRRLLFTLKYTITSVNLLTSVHREINSFPVNHSPTPTSKLSLPVATVSTK